jgi:hypothetical protein
MIDFHQVLVHHLLIFIKFTIFKSDFHQIHHSNFQMQLFEISHTDEKFFVYVNQIIRKRHSSLIVDIIERSASIESDQIRSNKSNQIKSNQIRSDQIKHVFIAYICKTGKRLLVRYRTGSRASSSSARVSLESPCPGYSITVKLNSRHQLLQ